MREITAAEAQAKHQETLRQAAWVGAAWVDAFVSCPSAELEAELMRFKGELAVALAGSGLTEAQVVRLHVARRAVSAALLVLSAARLEFSTRTIELTQRARSGQ